VIAILGRHNDAHAQCVRQELDANGHPSIVLDTEQLATGSLVHAIGSEPAVVLDDGSSSVAFEDVDVVWYRRPRNVAVPTAVFDHRDRRFARAEWADAVLGALLTAGARFVNEPEKEWAAVKPRQLAVAKTCGLRVPETLVTSDPCAAERFIERHRGDVIHKALTSPAHRFLDTRALSSEDRRHLETLSVAPTMFQERIHAAADLRVTVIGERLFTARFDTGQGRAGVDTRLDLDVPVAVVELDTELAARLLACMRALGLSMGTIDLRVPDEGDPVFLEINPQGQFLYVEILTGLPIAAALAEHLVGVGG
jgi:glutathione synthase/RimK-type ligase-like ATP-grasp enzyme